MSLMETEEVEKFKQDPSIKSKFKLKVETHFDAAHRLCRYNGKCKRIHGHTYKVIITVTAQSLLYWGAVMDFGDLKKILKERIEDTYDHKLILQTDDELNKEIGKVLPKDWIVWMDKNTTAENIAYDIYQEVKFALKDEGVVEEVILYETPNNAAIYSESKIENLKSVKLEGVSMKLYGDFNFKAWWNKKLTEIKMWIKLIKERIRNEHK